MLPSSDKQTSTKSHKKEEQRTFLILGLFWEKTSNKRHDVWYQCANDSPNRTVKWTRTDATFFSVKWKKSSEWFYPIRQLFHEFFQQLFQLDSHLSEVSQTPVSFSKLFFSYHCHTLAKIWKKILWNLWKHTSIYMKLWFLKFTSCQPPCLIYLF